MSDADEDAMIRGYEGIPDDDAALRSMGYVELCSKLSESEAGSVKYLVYEGEKRRRDNVLADENAKSSKHQLDKEAWYKRPTGLVVLPIVTGVILTVILAVLKWLRIPL